VRDVDIRQFGCNNFSHTDNEDIREQMKEWMALSGLGPNVALHDWEPGIRYFDTQYNWNATYALYGNIGEIGSFLENSNVKKYALTCSQLIS
jgi:hypothetical protein